MPSLETEQQNDLETLFDLLCEAQVPVSYCMKDSGSAQIIMTLESDHVLIHQDMRLTDKAGNPGALFIDGAHEILTDLGFDAVWLKPSETNNEGVHIL